MGSIRRADADLHAPDLRNHLLFGVEVDQLSGHARVGIGDQALEDAVARDGVFPACQAARPPLNPTWSRKSALPRGFHQPSVAFGPYPPIACEKRFVVEMSGVVVDGRRRGLKRPGEVQSQRIEIAHSLFFFLATTAETARSVLRRQIVCRMLHPNAANRTFVVHPHELDRGAAPTFAGVESLLPSAQLLAYARNFCEEQLLVTGEPGSSTDGEFETMGERPSVLRRSLLELQTQDEQGNKKPLEDVMRAWKGIKELPPDDPRLSSISAAITASHSGAPGGALATMPSGVVTATTATCLFPTWHRVYLFKLEEAMRSILKWVRDLSPCRTGMKRTATR